MSFKDNPFFARFSAMGDEAESVFERVYPQRFVRYGLNRPPIYMGDLPAFIRYTPDYLTAKGLVEVQGFGSDQLAKFKREKLTALSEWSRRFRVDLFLWDSTNQRYGWVRFPDLMIGLRTAMMKRFPEGTEYFAVPAEELPLAGEWAQP